MGLQPCLSKSTAHGLMNIGNAENWTSKLFWLLLTIAMLSCFLFHTFLLYSQLLEENVLVSTFPDSKPFIQPDFVFCSERFFARDFINHPPESEYEFMANVSRNIQSFESLFKKRRFKSSRLIWDSLNLSELYRAFFQRKHQLFLSLTCNMKDINIKQLIVEMNYVHFGCFRLKSSSCALNSPLDTLIVKFYTHIHGVNITYSNLDVRVNNRTIDSYLFIQKELVHEMEDGIHVYLVQPNEGITESTTRITASVNSHTTVKVRSTQYRKVSTKKTKCNREVKYSLLYNLLEGDRRHNPINITTESMCREIFFQNLVYKRTQCVLSRFPIPIGIPNNFTFCGDIRGRKSGADFLGVWNHPDLKADAISDCKANVSCEYVRHAAYVNYNHWPRISTLRDLFRNNIAKRIEHFKKNNLSGPGLTEAYADFQRNPSNIAAWKRNVLKISISPGEFMSTVVEESLAYTYKNFFSDVGGIMGFYLGASFLTLFELLRLMYCTVNTVRRKSAEDQQDEQISLKEHT